ncbi:MAG: alpha/beta hydrolase [Planctomycetota bacterium]
MSELLAAVEIEPGPGKTADAAVIWLHGLGADGHDFAPIVAELGLPLEMAVRFVLPHAPSIPVTINGGMMMPAWYDIAEVDLQRRHDEAGVRRSADQVTALMQREHERGVPWNRIVLAGFSQGGAISLFAGIRQPERLAGVIALSTYLVVEEALTAEVTLANRDVPILQGHGSIDEMVPFVRGEAARDRLQQEGYSVDFRSYPIGHGVSPDEIRDVREFLLRVLR